MFIFVLYGICLCNDLDYISPYIFLVHYCVKNFDINMRAVELITCLGCQVHCASQRKLYSQLYSIYCVKGKNLLCYVKTYLLVDLLTLRNPI